ncbi:MAG: TolC family protein [Bacteroidia bacterium]|nr:TolC family protein [Bacteroidia bacterium]NNF30763.1 TolC family protein [Flavobacteriaceae bacterium]MBT8277192.1 TolC family protein [Bacteroidia bacterium]NNJ81443.1 TolC family protein [Flavobacteriaceae bacterium]NNK54769.1 TolC family protein [Flavobacteriaceae bacterium]
MRNYLVILFLIMGVGASNGQGSKAYQFSLEEAISFALDSNYTAINSRRDIAKAIKLKWETTATGLPQLNANINYQNSLKQPVTLIPGEFTGGDPGTFVPVVFGVPQVASATATLEQLIFDGSYLVGLQAAKAFLDYSENADEKTLLEIRKGVINAYGSVLLSEELVAIFQKDKTTVERNLFETRKVYENGLAEEEDVEQLEITLLQIDTQLNRASRTLDIALQMFKVALGIDMNDSVNLTQNLDDLTRQNINLNFLNTNLNVEENVDYKIAFNLTEQRSLELKLEKSKALPTLNAFVNYATQANSDDFTFLETDQRWFQSSILGVSMNVPIFSSGLRGARTQQARIAVDQAKTVLEETIQNIRLEFETAKSNYQFTIENYENSKKNLSLAERIEQKNQVKFTEGIASSFDLRQAQAQLFNAQQEYFQSMLDVINAKTQLETVLNTPQLKN